MSSSSSSFDNEEMEAVDDFLVGNIDKN